MAEPQPTTPPLNPEKIFPVSWDQFHRDSRALAWRLNGAGPFEAIVSITRGGLVPAAIVARELGIRLIETVCVASYDHTSQGEVKLIKDVAPKLKTGAKILSDSVRADCREGDIGTELGEIAKKHPDVVIGSYPFMDERGGNTNVVVRSRDAQKLAAAKTAVEAMLTRVRAELAAGQA